MQERVPERLGPLAWVLFVLLLLGGCGGRPGGSSADAGPAAGAATEAPWSAVWGTGLMPDESPAAPDPADPWAAPLRDRSLRQLVRASAAGSTLRLRLSNRYGAEPLVIGAAAIARVATAPASALDAVPVAPTVAADSLRPLRFAGKPGIRIAPGEDAWSDELPFPIAAGEDLALQLHVVEGPLRATVHPGSRIASWAVAGDRAGASDWPAATPRLGWWFVDALDVRADAPRPVLVVTGDSLTDGHGVAPGSHQRWPDALKERIAGEGRIAAVVNTAIGAGRLLADGTGPSLVSRFERDVVARGGATHAVVLIGTNDLGVSHRGGEDTAASRAELLAALKQGFETLARQSRERGICLYGATVPPYGGSAYYRPTAENEAVRQQLNAWLRQPGRFDALLDFDALLRDPERVDHLAAAYDRGDGLHPSLDGYRAMAAAFPLDLLDRRCDGADEPPPAEATPARPATFENPVVPGFASDPSVCRSGDDYYLVTSTFEYLPGLPIYHSRDLVHWRLIGNALARAEQVDFTGRTSSKAIFAPTIRCDHGRFHIVTTDVEGIGSFLITASDPAGPWSKPVRLPEDVFTMDPSLFFDDDGTVYYTRHGELRDGGVFQARIDLFSGRLLEKPRLIWRGTGGIWPEGPHLYKRDGWYYLMIAEGGTSYEHRITMARSRSPWGPFEPHPDNPILTHMDAPESPFQALGHADLVETQDGHWWATLLAIRPQQVGADRHHHIGRETLLAPVRWREDGWPDIGVDRRLPQPLSTDGLPAWAPWPAPPVRETFTAADVLPPHWVMLRSVATHPWSLGERPGFLRLHGRPTGLESIDPPAFVGRRQERLHQRFATRMSFDPVDAADQAGIALRMNETHHVTLLVDGVGSRSLACAQQRGDARLEHARDAVPAGDLELQVVAQPREYTLQWRAADAADTTWRTLCRVPTHELSTETATGFTGVYFALHARSARTPATPADFAWVEFEATGP